MTTSESLRANVSGHSRGICVHEICKDCSPKAFHPPLSDHEELIAYFLGIIIASITVSSNSTLAKIFPLSRFRPCAPKIDGAVLLELEIVDIAACAEIVRCNAILPEYDVLLVVFGIHCYRLWSSTG